MSAFDLRGLLAALDEHGVRFVAIGGVAVAAHGYVRATRDLDIVPKFNPENVERLAQALAALDATLPTSSGRAFDPEADTAALLKRRNMTLDTRLGGLDVVQRAPGVPSYETLVERAVETDLLGISVKVCSLTDLRRMKEARADARDLADLEGLPES